MAGSGKRVATTCFCGRVTAEALTESEGFPVGRCGKCGTIRTLERPIDYESLYTDGERYHREAMDKIHRPHYTDRGEHDYALARERRIPRLMHHMASLDVGSANGAFVRAMQDYGFKAEGLELNPSIADWSREHMHAQVHTSWSSVRGPFDVVSYNDCFEHIPDPVEELARIRGVLRAGGLLVVDQPDAAEVFGDQARAPHHLKSSQHLWYFDESTMTKLVARQGFTVEAVDRPIVGKIVHYMRKNG